VTSPEPDWTRPVRISARLAEGIAEALGKRGHEVTAEQACAEMARPRAARSGIGEVITAVLDAAWADGRLVHGDLYVGLAAEAEELRLRQKSAELDRLSAERRRLSGRFREALGSGAPAGELLRLVEEQDAVLGQLIRLMQEVVPGQSPPPGHDPG
jgi:hypothetical protein